MTCWLGFVAFDPSDPVPGERSRIHWMCVLLGGSRVGNEIAGGRDTDLQVIQPVFAFVLRVSLFRATTFPAVFGLGSMCRSGSRSIF